MECEVEAVLGQLAQQGLVPRWAVLMEFWPSPKPTSMPDLTPLSAALSDYDALRRATEVLCYLKNGHATNVYRGKTVVESATSNGREP